MDKWEEKRGRVWRGEGFPKEETRTLSVYDSLLRNWIPIKVLFEEGLPEKEISIISESISSTLGEYGRVEEGSPICAELEEFLSEILEEFAVEMDHAAVRGFTLQIVAEHNKSLM
jgi:hypothetical protein